MFAGRHSSALIKVRLATLADIPAMVPVINAAFAVETFLEPPRTDEPGTVEMMQKGAFLLAKDSGDRLLSSVYIEANGDRGYFGMLAVDPAQQGRGLGRLMVQAAEDYCHSHGCEFMDISVLSLRTELLPFYHRFGYFESRTEEFHPSRPLKDGVECHCIIMSKPL